MGQDRTKSDELVLTHEFLSIMLGVRRAGISEAASKLQSKGLISYARGRVHIVDRQDLEATSCECYEVVKKEFDRLLAALCKIEFRLLQIIIPPIICLTVPVNTIVMFRRIIEKSWPRSEGSCPSLPLDFFHPDVDYWSKRRR